MVIAPGTFGILQTTPSTAQSLSREAIATRPQLGEDIYRSVNRLPGISSSEYSAQFHVRGGVAGEMLVLLDGVLASFGGGVRFRS